MLESSRESQFPNRPSQLKRGSLGTQPLSAAQPQHVRTQIVASVAGAIARIVRRLMWLAIIGFIGWQFLGFGWQSDWRQIEHRLDEFLVAIQRELLNLQANFPSEIQTTIQSETVSMPESETDNWQSHLEQALALSKKNQPEAAEAEFMSALFMAEDFGGHDERLTYVLDNFGYFYQGLGRNQEALTHYLRAIESYRETLGEEHEYFISLARRIAYTYRSEQEFEQAIVFLGQAVSAARGLHGEDYAGIAYGLQEVGDLWMRLGDSEQAANAYADGLTVAESVLGSGHDVTNRLKKGLSDAR